MRCAYVLAVCLFSLFPCLAFANSAPVTVEGVSGGNVVPIGNDAIRMVRERIAIECAWTTYSVRVGFVFENTTHTTQALQIGFPADYYVRYEDVHELEAANRSFKVECNGSPVGHTLGAIQPLDEYAVRQWIYWPARFAPGEQVAHSVSYTYPMRWKYPGSKEMEKFSYGAFLKYILKTGAAWSGPIESCIVEIDFSCPLPFALFELGEDDTQLDLRDLRMHPPGYQLDEAKRRVTWQFRNFVPEQDIYFGWRSVPDFTELDRDPPPRHGMP